MSQTSSFLSLPAELRNSIYEEVAKDIKVIEIRRGKFLGHPLMHTCRQVRREFSGIIERLAIEGAPLETTIVDFDYAPLVAALSSLPPDLAGYRELRVTHRFTRRRMLQMYAWNVPQWVEFAELWKAEGFDLTKEWDEGENELKIYPVLTVGNRKFEVIRGSPHGFSTWRGTPSDRCITVGGNLLSSAHTRNLDSYRLPFALHSFWCLSFRYLDHRDLWLASCRRPNAELFSGKRQWVEDSLKEGADVPARQTKRRRLNDGGHAVDSGFDVHGEETEIGHLERSLRSLGISPPSRTGPRLLV